jgi:hypothetical protein
MVVLTEVLNRAATGCVPCARPFYVTRQTLISCFFPSLPLAPESSMRTNIVCAPTLCAHQHCVRTNIVCAPMFCRPSCHRVRAHHLVICARLQDYDPVVDVHRLAEEYGKEKKVAIKCAQVSGQVRAVALDQVPRGCHLHVTHLLHVYGTKQYVSWNVDVILEIFSPCCESSPLCDLLFQCNR